MRDRLHQLANNLDAIIESDAVERWTIKDVLFCVRDCYRELAQCLPPEAPATAADRWVPGLEAVHLMKRERHDALLEAARAFREAWVPGLGAAQPERALKAADKLAALVLEIEPVAPDELPELPELTDGQIRVTCDACGHVDTCADTGEWHCPACSASAARVVEFPQPQCSITTIGTGKADE